MFTIEFEYSQNDVSGSFFLSWLYGEVPSSSAERLREERFEGD